MRGSEPVDFRWRRRHRHSHPGRSGEPFPFGRERPRLGAGRIHRADGADPHDHPHRDARGRDDALKLSRHSGRLFRGHPCRVACGDGLCSGARAQRRDTSSCRRRPSDFCHLCRRHAAREPRLGKAADVERSSRHGVICIKQPVPRACKA